MAEMTETQKVPVGECVAYSYGFLQRNWAELAPACLLMALVSGVYAMLPGIDANNALSMGFAIISALASAAYSAAVLRKAIHDERSGPFGVTFGADEVRVVLAGLALALAVMPVFLVAFTGLAFVAAGDGLAFEQMTTDPALLAEAVREKLGPAGSMGFMLFLLVCMGVVVWIWVRLFLVSAATMGERRLVTFATWAWTRGDFWRVFAAILATSLPPFLLSGIFVQITNTEPAGLISFLMGAAQGFVSAMLGIPALALAGHLYKGLRPPGFVAN
jgi:hypothetical protein